MASARRSASLCGLTTFDPVEDEIANALADLHFRDPLERKGVGHLDVDGIEPGIDHLHRPIGEAEPRAVVGMASVDAAMPSASSLQPSKTALAGMSGASAALSSSSVMSAGATDWLLMIPS
jgi:hypothetical protein